MMTPDQNATPPSGRNEENLQIVFLAAGLGSRYGGLKQLEAVGPRGATLMEYSLFDARRAGFGEAVFVIRPDMQATFREFAARFAGTIPWRLALQRQDAVPPGVTIPAARVKPWGTAHAVLAAAPHVTAPFAVLNADDFYGAEAFAALADFLRGPAGGGPPSYGLVGYRLVDTLSAAGPVNRAVCRIDPEGWLRSIEEVAGLEHADDDTIVSMNLWGFTPAVFPMLREGLAAFFRSADTRRDELLLPTVIQAALGRGECRVRVLRHGSRWFGITHQADRPGVEAALRDLVAGGRYPERLWT